MTQFKCPKCGQYWECNGNPNRIINTTEHEEGWHYVDKDGIKMQLCPSCSRNKRNIYIHQEKRNDILKRTTSEAIFLNLRSSRC